jgi:receptor protein-tyrosine kinase
MLIPKASHLVERAAERLLKSGALDQSAAHLLQPGAAPADDAGPIEPAQPAFGRRSSLFAPPPAAAVPEAPQPVHAGADRPTPATALGASQAAAVMTSPPILGQAASQASGVQAAVLERPTGPSITSAPGSVLPNGPAAAFAGSAFAARAPVDPAAGMLQGPVSIDAVSLERAGMVDWSRTRTRISEEFRLVQRQILRSAFGPGAEPGFSNLLLVTSARPGEGKSFMSTNLAGSIARQGDHHVLLIDADSKRDSICYSLGLAQSRGLLDLAANPKLDPAPLIIKTPIERLSIMPVGRERERSAELFSTKEMTRLIQSLGRRYADRLLILDAPPCLSTSDPAVLAQVVGQILFVVEADRTQRDEIEASLDLIQACPSITLVLNKQQISSRYTFGAYSSYYSS